MEYKSVTVYIVLFIMLVVVLFLLLFFDKNAATVTHKEAGAATAVPNSSLKGSDHMMVYINWDGFAWYYYTLTNGRSSTPVINNLAEEGVLFTDVCSGIPSITNPMQTSLLTGAWPSVTGNCYQYFDRKSRKIVRTGRTNKAENLAESVTRQGFKAASIHQFMLENRGTIAGNAQNPYIQLGNNADYKKRFNEAIRYVKNLKQGDLPVFLALYMDDLDGIGHNDWYTYGVPPAASESGRLESVLKRLGEMDEKLGEFIQACKDAGIYDKVSFLLTTDHGMTPYGIQDRGGDGAGRGAGIGAGIGADIGFSRLPEVVKELQKLGYRVEVLPEGKCPRKDTNIVLSSTGLEIQLFFTGPYDAKAADRISKALAGREYTGAIMNRTELQQRGASADFADMLVSAKSPYCFHNDKKLHKAGGQHDSLEESSQHIFALLWGRGVKKGLTYTKRVYSIDFAKTMSALIGTDSPRNSTGRLLDEVIG